MALDYNYFVDYIIPIIGLVISIVACIFTYLTYRKSHDILDVVDEERRYRWNQKELETLFSTIPIDSIERFFKTPDIIRNELWEGLRAVNLETFQYYGKERDLIVKFVNALESFCFMHYEQLPSGHWKFQPLTEKEPFNEDKEDEKIFELFERARALHPLFKEVKDILLKYHVNKRNINKIAYDFYFKKQEEERQDLQI